MNITYLKRFIAESNMIERIFDYNEASELRSYRILLGREELSAHFLTAFVQCIQPGVLLRGMHGMNVRIGDHIPQSGGPVVVERLNALLERTNKYYSDPFGTHVEYETLHPYTDCNGRSGRAIWLWQVQRRTTMAAESLTFLHQFYYHTLDHVGR